MSATSTPAGTAATGSISEKCTVRAKGGWLTATRAPHPGQIVRVADQRLIQTREGDWLIEDQGVLIEVCPEANLRKKYEVQVPGQTVLSPAVCRQLDDLLGIGAAESGERLVALVQRLAQLKLGTLTVTLTAPQAEEVARRASRNGLSPEQGLQKVFDRLQEELFPRTSGASGAPQ